MRRGEVWLTTFADAVAGEVQKTRPAIIISHEYIIHMLNRVQIIPTSSRLNPLYRFEVAISISGQPAKALVDQITTAAKRRLLRPLGEISADDMHRVEDTLRVQLGLV